jgi:CheY-like chemotaxis protein
MPVTVRFTVDVVERAPRPPTVLVMSDDKDWRAMLRRVLEEQGCRVLTARHAGDALVASMRHDGTVDLLLTDGNQGLRLADFPRRIFGDNPGLRLVHLERRPLTRDRLIAELSGALQQKP